ncbi:uncharacterized protein LOC135838751 [Planococcus citri]|uniref:uncharacterized protein LOC135838751 n=1 Tax=Planococcus citri TaxID=170843 RepID=UPI0031F85938
MNSSIDNVASRPGVSGNDPMEIGVGSNQSETKRQMVAFFSIRLLNKEMSFLHLLKIVEITTLIKWNAKIEEKRPHEGVIILSFPFQIKGETIMENMEQVSQIDMRHYITISKVDYLTQENRNHMEFLRSKYIRKGITCSICNYQRFNTEKELKNHQKTRNHLLQVIEKFYDENLEYICLTGDSAFKNRISTLIFVNKEPEITINHFFEKIKLSLVNYLETRLSIDPSLKCNFNLFCWYKKIDDEEQIFNLNTSNIPFFPNDNILEKLESQLISQIDVQNDEFTKRGSGWMFNSVSELEVRINKNDIIKAGAFIELPKALKNKKALINVQNTDDRCFYFCILLKFIGKKKNVQRPSVFRDFEKKLFETQKIKFNFSCI